MKLGSTRAVFKIGRYVVKMPRLRPWRSFLNGLLGNMQEVEFSRTGWPELCPVVLHIKGGWIVVMPYAEPLSKDDFGAIDFSAFLKHEGYAIPAEEKQDSFGWLNGELVAIDYGS